jgi:outer membrane protein assembly factor BamA
VRRLLLALSLLALSSTARAQQFLPPLDIHQRYEEQLITDTLKTLGLELDQNPLGKTIESIIVVPHDVFLHQFDPVPTFFNIFHITTKPYVIRQELLFREGDVIGPDTLAESERNLRGFFILSVARIVTARSATPGKVIIVVVAKDLWTLRPNLNFTIENGNLDYFSMTLAEHNMLGRNKFFGLNFRLDPSTYWFGEHYTDPRVWRTRIVLDEQVLISVNRFSGAAEGTYSRLNVGRPLYSLATEWGWDAGVNFDNTVNRVFSNGQEDPESTYNRNVLDAYVDGRRSFGLRYKTNLTAGYRYDYFHYTPVPTTNIALMPTSEDDPQLFWRVDFFEARFATFQNIQSFTLTEDFRFGPEAGFEMDWSPEAFGGTNSYLRVTGAVGWRWLLLRDDILWANIYGDIRYEPNFVGDKHCNHRSDDDTNWLNRSAGANLYNISPKVGFIRIFTRAGLGLNDCALFSPILLLGGTSGLRGYPAGTFGGSNIASFNLEARTKPIAVYTLYLGLVAFYDAGRVWFPREGPLGQPLPDVDLYLGSCCRIAGFHHDVGLGVRALFPQFNHVVVRLDVAWPFDHPPDYNPGIPVITAAFDQAF